MASFQTLLHVVLRKYIGLETRLPQSYFIQQLAHTLNTCAYPEIWKYLAHLFRQSNSVLIHAKVQQVVNAIA